jgi:hypothetical protein
MNYEICVEFRKMNCEICVVFREKDFEICVVGGGFIIDYKIVILMMWTPSASMIENVDVERSRGDGCERKTERSGVWRERNRP